SVEGEMEFQQCLVGRRCEPRAWRIAFENADLALPNPAFEAALASTALGAHAFSPLEIMYGAESLSVAPIRLLEILADAGLGSLPGTAAEILDDDVRARLCPDKLKTREWLTIVEAAHPGCRPRRRSCSGTWTGDWARHILHIRDLQERTGG